MSKDSVEVVRQAFEALREEGSEAVLCHIATDVIWEVRSDLPDAATYRGHEGMRELFGRFDEVLDESWYEPREMIDTADQVVVVLGWGGRGRRSGIEVEEREEAWVMAVRGERIVHVREYATKHAALEAAGISE